MAWQNILNGTVLNDGTGDTGQAGFTKVDDNFLEVYSLDSNGDPNTSVQNRVLATGNGSDTASTFRALVSSEIPSTLSGKTFTTTTVDTGASITTPTINTVSLTGTSLTNATITNPASTGGTIDGVTFVNPTLINSGSIAKNRKLLLTRDLTDTVNGYDHEVFLSESASSESWSNFMLLEVEIKGAVQSSSNFYVSITETDGVPYTNNAGITRYYTSSSSAPSSQVNTSLRATITVINDSPWDGKFTIYNHNNPTNQAGILIDGEVNWATATPVLMMGLVQMHINNSGLGLPLSGFSALRISPNSVEGSTSLAWTAGTIKLYGVQG